MSQPLYIKHGRRYRLATHQHLQEAVNEAVEKQYIRGREVKNPEVSRQIARNRLALCTSEVFACMFLDNRHRLRAIEDMFFGTIDRASVYPREVVKRALFHNAAAVILFHNHPSGTVEPSQADIQITKRLQDALDLIDVKVLDHIVVAGFESVSMAQRGLM